MLMGLDFSMLIGFVPLILVIGGFVASSRLFGVFAKGAAEKVLKAIGILGFFVGIILIITGITALLTHAFDFVTWGLLILTGLGLALKPLSKVPFSALFGLVAGAICVGLLYYFFPLPATILGVSSMWIYLAVFFVPALLVYLLLKFVEDVMKLFSLILGSWPVVTVLGVLCILQGILLYFSHSLQLLLP